ncbi:MAG: PIN domain-containing protein [Caldilineaceae bacterium]
MDLKFILDTHALIWFLEGNRRLGTQAQTVIADPDSQLVLPVIALAEATLVIDRGRTTISSSQYFMQRLLADPRIEIYPLTLEIFVRSQSSKGLLIPELHDRLIVSTGLYLQDQGNRVQIVTADQSITAANVLPVVW